MSDFYRDIISVILGILLVNLLWGSFNDFMIVK